MNLEAVHLWLKRNEGTVEVFDFCGGAAVGFSERSPDKQTDNEDAAGLFAVSDGSAVLAVADGLGGANCGDRASQAVIESILSRIKMVESFDLLRESILDSIEAANETILGWGIGAGATLAVAVFAEGRIRAFHVGDAMILLCSNRGRVKYSTVAHSPVAMAVEIGVMNESEAIRHEDRNLITNCIGSREMRIEIGPPIKMSARDTLIVSSDGLFDNLLPAEIAAFIRSGQLQSQATSLFKVAKKRMLNPDGNHPTKPDDLTALCFRQVKHKTVSAVTAK